MFSSIYEDFTNNTLTEKKIIISTLSELGSGLYTYLIFLENTGRPGAEWKLIENLRNKIFDTRELYRENEITKVEIYHCLTSVFDLLSVQLTMISVDPLKSWENKFFSMYIGDLVSFKEMMK